MNYRVSMVDKMLMQKLSDSRQLVQNDLDQSIRNHELCMDQFVFGIQHFKSYYSEQKDFYEVINTKLDISLFVAEKDSIIKDLREYRKKYEKVFYNVRNAAVAHRDVNVMAQIEVIENLNFSEAIEIILKFNELLSEH